jgi:hypothetical protein
VIVAIYVDIFAFYSNTGEMQKVRKALSNKCYQLRMHDDDMVTDPTWRALVNSVMNLRVP